VLTAEVDFLARMSESITLMRTGFDLFPVPSGTGWGMDLGISGGITSALSFGLSVTDIGSVHWTENTREAYTQATLEIDNPLDPEQQAEILNAISGSGERNTGSFEAPLPTTMRFGLALELHRMLDGLPGGLVFGFDIHRGVRDVPGSTTKPRMSFGGECALLPMFPLRAGVSFGGMVESNFSVGLGLRAGPLAIDLATDNAGWFVNPSRFPYSSFAGGVSLIF
jgi:hypothetical protein